MSWRAVGGVMLLLAHCSGGCTPAEQIPRYPMMDPQQTLGKLSERSAAIHAISGQGTLRLTRDNGDGVLLDAALVIAPSERARVRAWKFGSAVFDLTVVPGGVYLVAPERSAQRQQIASAGGSAANMIRNWLKLLSGSFDPSDASESGANLLIRRKQDDGTTLLCTIDRHTITPRSYRLLDDRGHERFAIDLTRYVESNGQVWPTRIEATSAEGQIRVDLREVEVNGELPPQVFVPPARAEKLP